MTKTLPPNKTPLVRLADVARATGVGAELIAGAVARGETPPGVKLRELGFGQIRYVVRPDLLDAWLRGDKPPQQDDCADLF